MMMMICGDETRRRTFGGDVMVSGDHDGGDDYDGDVTKTRNKIVMLVISFFFCTQR